MIDNLKISGLIDPPPEVYEGVKHPIQWHGIEFANDHARNEDNTLKGYQTTLKGLYLFIRGPELFITNSIHKFHHGHNGGDFHLSEIKEAFEQLGELLQTNLKDFKVNKIEYGVNLPVVTTTLLSQWGMYKGRVFKSMENRGKVYGKKVSSFSDYSIKGYDKAYELETNQQHNHSGNLFRFEVQAKYIRHLNKRSHPIGIDTVRDLWNIEKMSKLKRDLIQKAKMIEKSTGIMIEYPDLNPSEIKLILAMQNPTARALIRKANLRTYNRDKRKYDKLVKEFGKKSNIDLPGLIAGKWEELESGFSNLYYS